MRPFPKMNLTDGVTEEQQKALFSAVLTFKEGHIADTCKSIGVTRRKYRQWLESDPEFAEDCQDAMESLIDLTQSKLVENIKDGVSRDIQFFLKTQGRHRGYGERVEHEHSGMIGHAHAIGWYPKEPETLAEWEAQVIEARRLREQSEQGANTLDSGQDSTSPVTKPSDTLNTGPVAPALALVEVTS
jgi:hypothetical protein